MLEPLGISGFEESVLRSLLTAEQRSVVELAEDLDVPQDTVRRAVRRLVEAGAKKRTAASVVAELTGTSANALYRALTGS